MYWFCMICRKKKRPIEEYEKENGRSFRGKTLTVNVESRRKTIVDDGYRWRKYGQKTIKGNLFPRYVFSLYSFTSNFVYISVYINIYIYMVLQLIYYYRVYTYLSSKKHPKKNLCSL